MNKRLCEKFINDNGNCGETVVLNCLNQSIEFKICVGNSLEFENECIYITQEDIQLDSRKKISMIPYDSIITIDIIKK